MSDHTDPSKDIGKAGRRIGNVGQLIQDSYNPEWSSHIVLNRSWANPIDTDVSTEQTVHKMIGLAKSYSKSPIIFYALQAAIPIPPNNPVMIRDLARQIFWWIKNTVMFVEDEAMLSMGMGEREDKELLIAPDALLSMQQPIGDCDDFSLLGASMLLGVGIPTSYVTVAADNKEKERFSHIYLKIYLIDECQQDGTVPSMAMDISHGFYPGWETQDIFRKREWFIC